MKNYVLKYNFNISATVGYVVWIEVMESVYTFRPLIAIKLISNWCNFWKWVYFILGSSPRSLNCCTLHTPLPPTKCLFLAFRSLEPVMGVAWTDGCIGMRSQLWQGEAQHRSDRPSSPSDAGSAREHWTKLIALLTAWCSVLTHWGRGF